MKYDKECGQFLFGKGEHALWFTNNWEQLKFLFGDRFNWYEWNVALFEIYIEKDKVMDGVELRLALLGFGLNFRYNLEPGEQAKEIISRADEMKNKYKETL